MKGKHLHIVSPPGNRFATGTQLQSNQVVDGTGRRVFAGNPLWIEECQWSWFDGNRELAMDHIPRGVSRIDAKRHRLGQRGNTCEKQNYADTKDSNYLHASIEPRTAHGHKSRGLAMGWLDLIRVAI